MNIMITGGNGFIMSNLIDNLLKHPIYCKDSIFNIDNKLDINNYNIGKPIKYILCNIVNPNYVEEAFKKAKPDIVIHGAAESGIAASLSETPYSFKANVVGTFNMLENARRFEVKKFIFTSSGAVIGNANPPLTEKMPLNPISPYGSFKAACEHLCNVYYHSFNVPTTVLRFSNVYGPNMKHKTSIIPTIIKRVLENKHVVQNGDGEQTRDFVYVGDICNAIISVISSNKTNGETFHVSTGQPTSIKELIDKIDLIGKSICPLWNMTKETNYKPIVGDVRINYADSSKIQNLLNWRPETLLNNGLELTIKSFLNK